MAQSAHKGLGEESRKRFEKARQNPALFDDAEQLRTALLDFIVDFANWDNSTVREYLDTSRALTQAAHEALVGYLPTGVSPSASTPEVILECGYNYWMDPQHEETPDTLKVKGKELTVLAYFQDLNDYSSYQRAGRTPRDLLQMWKDCFDCLYEEGATDPKFMIWGNHPFVGGRPFRAHLLREFIRYAKSHGKVWFATAGELAKWYRENYRDAQVETWPNFAVAGRAGTLKDLTTA